MAVIIGVIRPNEGFTVIKRATTAWNVFRVNVTRNNIAVYDVRRNYMDYVVRFRSYSGAWRWGYIASNEYNDLDIVISRTRGIGVSGVRSYAAAINGKSYSVMIARRALNRYNKQARLLGPLPRGSAIAFTTGYSGANNHHWLYAEYFKKPGSSTWHRIDTLGKTAGWVNTECNTRGYGAFWGLDGARN